MKATGLVGLGVGVGAAAWTLTEYISHRWVLHGPFGKGRLARVPLGGLHRAHHRQPLTTVPAARVAGHTAIASAGALGALALSKVLPRPFAAAAGAAWSTGYTSYEISHWLAHHRAPRTRYGVNLRRRHFRHHFGAPNTNLGVTVNWWDILLGTESDSDITTIPARHAPPWMVDKHGAVRPELQPEFALLDG